MDITKTSKKLFDKSQNRDHQSTSIVLSHIDHTRPYLPPTYTQLFYTPIWDDLDTKHRLRYVQLYGLRTNEMIVLFESLLVQQVIPKIQTIPVVQQYPELVNLLKVMASEEQTHFKMFKALNHAFGHDVYKANEYIFFKPSIEVRVMTRFMAWCARWLAYSLWLLLYIEEATLVMARDMMAMETESDLGPIEANWLKVYLEHTKDESRHVEIDKLIFDVCYTSRNRLMRICDGQMFVYVLKSLIFPRSNGAGVQVISQLVEEFPELGDLKPKMVNEIKLLRENPAFLSSLVSHRLTPQSLRLFNRCSELNRLGKLIPNYAI